MSEYLTAYLHYLSIMILFAALFSEHLLLKPGISAKQIKSLIITDAIYGISAISVLITGLLRMIYFGKGVSYYMKNPYFHTKLTLFIIIAILSIKPTIEFMRWRRSLKKNEDVKINDELIKRLQLFIRIELLFVLIIPLMAVLMARGYGATF
ncbi:MAG: DUF2214 family protein [Calditrichaeota bacterium]|nr:DUF2214 family protein [Calditrichota bacterium]